MSDASAIIQLGVKRFQRPHFPRQAQEAWVGGDSPFRAVLDSLPAAVYTTDAAGRITYYNDAIGSKNLNGIITSWNRGAEQLFNYTAEEVIGKPVTILIPADRQDEEPGILERVRRGERIDHYETVRRRKDGSLVEISLTVSPVKNAEGWIIGVSKIARDITE